MLPEQTILDVYLWFSSVANSYTQPSLVAQFLQETSRTMWRPVSITRSCTSEYTRFTTLWNKNARPGNKNVYVLTTHNNIEADGSMLCPTSYWLRPMFSKGSFPADMMMMKNTLVHHVQILNLRLMFKKYVFFPWIIIVFLLHFQWAQQWSTDIMGITMPIEFQAINYDTQGTIMPLHSCTPYT